jgi:hypothetical protein
MLSSQNAQFEQDATLIDVKNPALYLHIIGICIDFQQQKARFYRYKGASGDAAE